MRAESLRVTVRARLEGSELDLEHIRDRLEDALGIALKYELEAVDGNLVCELVGELEIPYRIKVGRAGRVGPSEPVCCDACGEALRSLEPYVVELTSRAIQNRLYHPECKPDK